MRLLKLLRGVSLSFVFLLLSTYGFAQKLPVNGKIIGADGQPLSGVTIEIKGSNQRTLSNADGTFHIEVPSSNSVLVFSYVGFTQQEVAVGSKKEISISMEPQNSALQDVVVVGYGTQKKSDVTGSLVRVGADEIRKRPVANALQAMQGKAAGVDITSNERPGEMGSILIRGKRSITASSNPLYVVDGIPLPIGGGGLEALNPNDIESIDILKDASATAIYGSRGANGVVLVTTKQGKKGKLSLNYVGTMTVEKMYDRTDMMNSEQYIEFRRDAYRRVKYLKSDAIATSTYPDVPTIEDDKRIFGVDPYAWANVAKGWANGTWNGSLVPTTDWTGMVLQTGITQDHSINASGGTDKMRTYASFGYLNQDGTQLGQDFKRYSGKFSSELKPVKWFTMGGNLTATYSVQNYGFATTNATGASNLYFAAQGMLPYAVPYDSTGKRINLPGGDINILNPIGEEKYTVNERKVLRLLGSLYAEVNILKGLKYRVNFGPDFYNLRNGIYRDAYSVNRGAGESGSTNYAQLNQNNKFSWTLDNLIYYDQTFASKHHINLTLLQSASADHFESSSMTATKLPWTSQKWNQLNSVSALDGFSSNLIEKQLSSYMGRINYDFNSRFLLTASGRWDGASQLADGHKWDFFPSAALGYRLDQENFIKNIAWINQLKLRLGYGVTGNSAVDPYSTKGPLQTLYYTYGSTVVPGYVSSDPSSADPISMANLELGWEKTAQVNLGLDFDLLKGRISGALDVYASKTTDLLLESAIPSLSGYTKTWANVGETANKGVELTLNTVNIKKNNFTWSSNLSFAANRDRITKLAAGKFDDISNLRFIDERIGVYYDYVKEGIWQESDEDKALIAKYKANGITFNPGDIKVADLNGDLKIDANNDRKIVGHTSPDWAGGMSNTFNYKNWDLSFFIYARWGFTIATGAESLQGRFAQRVVDYWTPNNPTNAYPSPNYGSASGDAFKSSMNYQDGSFVKMRNISLGYNLSKELSDKLHLSNFKVYAQVQNPGLLYSKIDWIDPDLGGSTFNRGFVLGVNLGF